MKATSLLFTLALLSCSPTASQGPDIVVDGAWARATLGAKPASAAYLTVSNRGGTDDALVAVTSSVGTAAIHSMSMDGGIMRMRKLDSLPVPAGSTVKLEPGGTHVMLTELGEPLVAGQRIELTLKFAKAPQQTVAAEIRAPSGEHE